MPSPKHLEEVKKCLSSIQGVLGQICRFWGHVSVKLDGVMQQTFAVDGLTEDIKDFKEEILDAINDAEEVTLVNININGG